MKLRFKTKIFLSLFVLASTMTLIVGYVLYYAQKRDFEKEFLNKHNSIAEVISNNLKQAESLTDQLMFNTALGLNDKVQNKKISKLELQKLRSDFHMTDLYLINQDGKYIESTDDFAQKGNFNFYNFCPDYRNIIKKGNSFSQTPILLAYPPNNKKPYKFTQLSTMDRKQIIEVGMHLSFIQDILKTSLANYSSIKSLNLKTPSGDVLGVIKSNNYDPSEDLSRVNIRVSSNDLNCCQCKVKKLTNDTYYYDLELYISKIELMAKISNLVKLIFLIELILIICSYFFSKFITVNILSRLNSLAKTVEKITDTGELIFTKDDHADDEIDLLGRSFNKMIQNLINKERQIKETEKLKATYQLATQVAHDIRSPLELLKSIKNDILQLPEDARRRVQMGINRIEEITFNLLKTYKQENNREEKLNSEELLSILESVFEEKKIEFSNYINIHLNCKFSAESYGLFSKIKRGNLKNIISNIINNSFDSLANNTGVITINLFLEDSWNVITISDTGKGIADSIKSSLFQKGFTTKENGTGIGLFNSKEEICSLGGEIKIDNNTTKGTIVSIYLPASIPSQAFIKTIQLYKYEKIIILDDDLAFHEVWKLKLKDENKIIEHFYSIKDFYLKYTKLPGNCLLLSDFELMDKGKDGIDVILETNHINNSILVTARSEEFSIQERCNKNGIKLLSKSLISYVGLIRNSPQIILIDDDKLTHLSWEYYLKTKNYRYSLFYTVDEFLLHSFSIDKDSLIYIDSDLGNNVKGEVESKKIYDLGYRNLYLATGYSKESIKAPHWILEIYSKNPSLIFQESSST